MSKRVYLFLYDSCVCVLYISANTHIHNIAEATPAMCAYRMHIAINTSVTIEKFCWWMRIKKGNNTTGMFIGGSLE